MQNCVSFRFSSQVYIEILTKRSTRLMTREPLRGEMINYFIIIHNSIPKMICICNLAIASIGITV